MLTNNAGLVQDLDAPPSAAQPEFSQPHPSEISSEKVALGIGGHYVYAHRNTQGEVFYIGKGSGDFAWSWDRSQTWLTYVHRHSSGSFTVQVLSYHSISQEAREQALKLIQRYGPFLINEEEAGRPRQES